MRVLVIGGTQFMGRAIAERLANRGDEVAVLHRGAHHDLGPAVRNLQGDRGDLPAVVALLARERFNVVVDMAYDMTKGTTADDVEAAAVAAMSTGDLHRYVFMSSIAAYGSGFDHREHDPLAPDTVENPYVVHKASTERMLFRLRDQLGLPVTTFRPPFVHGPRQPLYREQFFWDRLHDGRPIILPDAGDTPMQWAFVHDIADACVRAIELPAAAGEAFNVAHVEPLTQRTYVEALARVAGVPPHLVPVPRTRIRAAGGQLFGHSLYFGEFLDPPPFTEIVEKAPRLLGFAPTPFDRALAAGYEWYLSEPRRPIDYAFEDRLLA